MGTPGSFPVMTQAGDLPAPLITETGALPGGVTFNPATGILGGTPSAGMGGTYTMTFNAANGVGTAATQSFVLTVDQAPAITSGAAATLTVSTSEQPSRSRTAASRPRR